MVYFPGEGCGCDSAKAEEHRMKDLACISHVLEAGGLHPKAYIELTSSAIKACLLRLTLRNSTDATFDEVQEMMIHGICDQMFKGERTE